jgi:hypothetical protein
MHVKGFTRVGAAVVNTDTSEFEMIRQRRSQKRVQDQVQGELQHLRDMVMALTKRIEVLERG